jgi:hypothetical protein
MNGAPGPYVGRWARCVLMISVLLKQRNVTSQAAIA